MPRYATNGRAPIDVDCLVLGGGITGAGVARDAAMRGLRTMLVDTADFASGTSHLTSKVVHGGLRYLEHGHFRLVAEGLVERDRLLNKMAPHLVRPLRFTIPFESNRLVKWAATVLGLQAYGLIEHVRAGRRSSPMSTWGLKRHHPALRSHPFGVSFWDAQTNDARLVMAVLRTASAAGAKLLNYATSTHAEFDGQQWTFRFVSEPRRRGWTVRARSVVNATGPWSPMTAEMLGSQPGELHWIKGSHLLLDRPADFGNDAVVIRSLRDRRALWVIPWENRLIIGSTESRFIGDLRRVHATKDEVDDLLSSFNHYFPALAAGYEDIRCAYAGVRPIVKQDAECENGMSRRHTLTLDAARKLVSVSGGKLTTFRRMAEEAVDELSTVAAWPTPAPAVREMLRQGALWPALTKDDSSIICSQVFRHYPELGDIREQVEHLVRLYGRDGVPVALEAAESPSMAERINPELPHCLAELAFLCRTEHVCHLSDLLKRRTPLYFLSDGGCADWLGQIVDHIAPILHWDWQRREFEIESVLAAHRADCAAFAPADEELVYPRLAAACA